MRTWLAARYRTATWDDILERMRDPLFNEDSPMVAGLKKLSDGLDVVIEKMKLLKAEDEKREKLDRDLPAPEGFWQKLNPFNQRNIDREQRMLHPELDDQKKSTDENTEATKKLTELIQLQTNIQLASMQGNGAGGIMNAAYQPGGGGGMGRPFGGGGYRNLGQSYGTGGDAGVDGGAAGTPRMSQGKREVAQIAAKALRAGGMSENMIAGMVKHRWTKAAAIRTAARNVYAALSGDRSTACARGLNRRRAAPGAITYSALGCPEKVRRQPRPLRSAGRDGLPRQGISRPLRRQRGEGHRHGHAGDARQEIRGLRPRIPTASAWISRRQNGEIFARRAGGADRGTGSEVRRRPMRRCQHRRRPLPISRRRGWATFWTTGSFAKSRIEVRSRRTFRARPMAGRPGIRNNMLTEKGLRDAVIRRSLDGMANNVHKVQGNASIRVDVNAPKNTHVGAEASGLFNTIETYRQTQMAAAQRGPANWGSVP